MRKKPFILEAECSAGKKDKVKIILKFYLKEELQDLEVDEEKILESLERLYGNMLTGICSNVAGSIYILPNDIELAKKLIDVVTLDTREPAVPIVAENTTFIKGKERDFLVAYM